MTDLPILQRGLMGPEPTDMEAALRGDPQPGPAAAPSAPSGAPGMGRPFMWTDLPGGSMLSRDWRKRTNERLAKTKGFTDAPIPAPFIGTAKEVNQILEMRSLGAKLDLGKASPQEAERYYDWYVDSGLRENSFMGGVGELLSGSLEFGGEFAAGALTGGAAAGAALAQRGARRALLKVASRAQSRFIARAMKTAAASGTTLVAQEAVPRLGAPGGAWTANMIDAALLNEPLSVEEKTQIADDMNALIPVALERGGSMFQGFALQAVEVASESAGGPLGKIPPVAYLNGLFGTALRKLRGRVPAKDFGKALADAAQWNGPFPEVLEEVIAEAGKAALIEGRTVPEALSQLSGNLPEMLVAFSIPGATGAAAGRASDAARLALGKDVEGRTGVGGVAPGEVDTEGAVEPQGAAAPVLAPLDDATAARAVENYNKAHSTTFGSDLGGTERVQAETVAQALATRIAEQSGARMMLVRSKDPDIKTRGYYDTETDTILLEADSPQVVRTAFHEIGHSKWAKWTPQQRQEFVSTLDAIDPGFLTEAQAEWEGTLEPGAQASDALKQDEAQATGAEMVAPVMEFLQTERGARLAEVSEKARPGTARRLYEFATDFLRAMGGLTPKAPTTALRALERTVRAAKGTGGDLAKLAGAYNRAWAATAKAIQTEPATPSSMAAMDVFSQFDPQGELASMAEPDAGPDAAMTDRVPAFRTIRQGQARKATEGDGSQRKATEDRSVPSEPESKKRDRGGKRAKAQAAKRAEEEAEAEKARANEDEKIKKAREAMERSGNTLDRAIERVAPKPDPAPPRANIDPEGLIGGGLTPLFARRFRSEQEARTSQREYDMRLSTRKGRAGIADELERFLSNLYDGRPAPTEAREYIAALRGEGQNEKLAEEVQDARTRLDRESRFARRKGGRYRQTLQFRDELGLTEIAESIASSPGISPTPRRAPASPDLGLTKDELGAMGDIAQRGLVEGDQTQLGRPGLNNPAATAAGRSVVRAVDEERRAKAEVRSLDRVALEAQEALQKPDERARLEEKLASGAQLTDTETVEAVRVLDELSAKWMGSRSADDFRAAALWGQALRASRTEQARGLGATRRQGMSAAATFAEALVAPGRNQERRMRALRRKMEAVVRAKQAPAPAPYQLGGIFATKAQATAAKRRISVDGFDRDTGRMVSPAVWARLVAEEKALLAEIQDATQRGLDAVSALGVTPQQMQKVWLDPVAGRPVRAAFGAAKANLSDKLFEWRYMAILSGMRTHVKNTAGNAANFFIEGVMQPTFEGFANIVVQDQNSANWDEGVTFLRGARAVAREAVRNAWLAWRGDIPVLELAMNKAGANVGAYTSRADAIEADRVAPALDNVVASTLRKTSLSLLLAMDEFWKTLAVGGQSLALATRVARGEGHSGAALARRVSALLATKDHPLWAEAIDKARKIAFQDEGGKVSQSVARAAFGMRTALDTATPYLFLGTTLLPFVGTPVRVFANVIRRSPLNIAQFAGRFLRAKYRGRPDDLVRESADAAIAALITLSVWALMDDDEDGLPRITGARPKDRGEAEMMQRLGVPELSIRVGDRWHQFKDIEPISTSLGIMVDAVSEFRRSGSLGAAQAALSSALEQAKDKTFVRTLGELYELTQPTPNRAGKAADLLSFSFVTPWMPNLIRQPLRAADDNVRVRVRQQEGESIFVTTMKDIPYQMIPSEALAPEARYDLWGRPVFKEATQAPSNVIVRLLSPTLPQGRKGEQVKADLWLKAYNDAARAGKFGDEDPSYPVLPSYTFEREGVVHRWTNEEYAELTRVGGERAAEAVARLVDQGVLSMENPRPEQFEAMRRTISAARKGIAAELKEKRQGPALRASP